MHRKETKRNIESLNIDLAQEQWIDILQINDGNQAYENFINKLLYYYDKNVPLVRVKPHKKIKNPWITKGIMTSIRTRNRLYKKAIKESSDANRSVYRRYRNKLTSLIRLSRKLYYSKKIDSNKDNNNEIWHIVKDLIGKKSNNSKTFINDGQEINDPEQIANMFNTYFVNVGPNLASKIEVIEDHFSEFLSEPCNKSLFYDRPIPMKFCKLFKLLKVVHPQVMMVLV